MNKSTLLIDELIYPKKLIDIIKEQINKKEFAPSFFGKEYVRLMVIADSDKKRLDETSTKIQAIFKNFVENMELLMIDNEETQRELISIREQINNGISEKAFYDWFMRLAFQCRQFTIPLHASGEPREGYNPISKIVQFEFDNGMNSNYIFFCNNESLLNPITINELIKKADVIIQNKLNGKKTKKNKRKPLDTKLRHECFKRDGYKCLECGATNKEKTLHADHIIPVSQGGSDELSNLQTLCDDCNLAKYNKAWVGGKEGEE